MKKLLVCIGPLLFLLFSCGSNRKDTPTTLKPVVETTDQRDKSSEKRSFQVSELNIKGVSPIFFNNDQTILFSKSNYVGLWLYDLKSKKVEEITDARGAGYQPLIIGNEVLYKVKSKKTIYEVFKAADRTSRSFDKMEEGIREMLAASQRDTKVAIIADDLNSILVLTKTDEVRKMTPGNLKQYVNACFSPDGRRLLFEVSGKGGYIADSDGQVVKHIDTLDHPKWINNDEILFTRITDDGSKNTGGELFIYNFVSDSEYAISQDYEGIIVHASSDETGRNIVASTLEGNLILFSKK
jgi:hypothetical protein